MVNKSMALFQFNLTALALTALLLCLAVDTSSCNDWYSVTIIPSESVSVRCLALVQHLGNCLTLRQFVMNKTNHSFWNLTFLPGEHLLESDLVIRGAEKFLMHGSNTTQMSASVVCSKNSSEKITFSNIHLVSIKNLNFSLCEGIRVESVENVTVQDCNFQDQILSLNYIMLSVVDSDVTIKNSLFFSDKAYSNNTLHSNRSHGPEKFMIVSNASIISVQGGTFRALWCGVLYSEKSWISINDAKICTSTVTVLPPGVRREHLALVKLVTSTLNLKNSTISNNTRSVILLAKHCNISIDKSSISENVATFSVVLFAKTYTNITDGNMHVQE